MARHANIAGGLEKQLRQIAYAFAARKVAVNLVTAAPQLTNQFSNLIQCHSLQVKKTLRCRAPKAFDRACRLWHDSHRHPVVFGIDRISFATHLRAGNGVHRAYLEKRALFSPRIRAFKDCFNPLHRTLLKLECEAFTSPTLRLIFTNSEMVKRDILRFYPVDEKTIHVIYNGVEWNEFAVPFSAWQSRKQHLCRALALNPSDYHFLFIGHGFRRKGLSLLLTAFAALQERNCHLSIVGKDSHLSFFQAQCHRLGIAKRVTFFGPRQDVIPFYTVSDCLVIPSLYDPCANVTVEGLAMGLYIVSSPFNGGSEMLTTANGTVIPRLDAKDAFVAALKTALARPKTADQATHIRRSAQQFTFTRQLTTLVDATLRTLP